MAQSAIQPYNMKGDETERRKTERQQDAETAAQDRRTTTDDRRDGKMADGGTRGDGK